MLSYEKVWLFFKRLSWSASLITEKGKDLGRVKCQSSFPESADGGRRSDVVEFAAMLGG